LLAWSVVGFGALAGSGTTLQFMLAVGERFGGREYAAHVLLMSAVRSLAPAAVGSALLLALVLWARALTSQQLLADLRRILVRGLLAAVPGYVLAAVVAVVTGAALALAFGQPLAIFRNGMSVLNVVDLGVGVVNTAFDAALVVALAWRYLPKLQLLRASLPAKLALVLTVTAPLRVTLALVVASFWPG
jgi:hypothetical protein